MKVTSANSKWKAALKKGLDVKPEKEDNILYLGASSGTTISYIKELTKGIIFAVENSPDMAVELIKLTMKSDNIAPVFCDARDTDYIRKAIFNTRIDLIFQDIPSRDQVEILEKNSEFLKKDGKIFLSLKTQSISQQKPSETLKQVKEKLNRNFKVLKEIRLEPFHKKHYFLVLTKR